MRFKIGRGLSVAMLSLVGLAGMAQTAVPRLWQLERVGEPLHQYGRVTELAISPDGKRVAAVGDSLRLWDAHTGDPISKPMVQHEQGIVSVAWSPDGRFVATGGYDGMLVMWDADKFRLLWKAKTRQGYVTAIAFSPDGARLATGGNQSGMIRLWDGGSGREVGSPLTGHAKEVRALTFADDRTLLSATPDGAIRVWNVDSRETLRTIQTGMAQGAQRLALHPHQPVVAGSSNDSIAFWDVRTGLPAAGPLNGSFPTHGIAFSEDGRHLMTALAGGAVALVDWQSGKIAARGAVQHRGGVQWQTAFGARGGLLVTASNDGVLGIWRATLADAQVPFEMREIAQISPPEGDARGVVSDDGRYVAFASQRLVIVDRADGKQLVNVEAGRVGFMQFSPDGRTLAFIDGQYRVNLIDVQTRERRVSAGNLRQVDQAGAFSPDGRRLALGIHERSTYLVVVLDTATGAVIGRYSLPGGGEPRILSVDYNADASMIVAAALNNTVYPIYPGRAQPIGTPWRGAGYFAKFSPDGRRVVAARRGDHNSHELVVFDALTGTQLGNPMSGHSEMIHALAVMPDGRHVLSGCIDGSVALWDSAAGARIGQERVSRSVNLHPYQITRNARRMYTVGSGGNPPLPVVLHEWAIARHNASQGEVTGTTPAGMTDVVLASEVVGQLDQTEAQAAAFDARTGQLTYGGFGMLRFFSVKDGTRRETGDYIHTRDERPEIANIWSVAVSPDGQRATAGPDGAEMHVYDVASGQRVSIVKNFGHGPHIFLADGRLAVAAERGLRLINPDKGTLQSQLRYPLTGQATALGAARRALRVALGTDQGQLLLASVDGNAQVVSIDLAQRGAVTVIAFSPDDQLVVSGGSDGKLNVFDAQTGRRMGSSWPAHQSAVSTVAFSADGQHVASGASDGTLRIWSLSTGKPVTNALVSHSGAALAILPQESGHWLSIGTDGVLRRWSLTPAAQPAAAASVR